jgi:hypothetical protein
MRILGLVILACAIFCGCSGAHGSAQQAAPAAKDARGAVNVPTADAVPAAAFPVPAAREQTRVTERDVDADGIADYRVFVTESFDAEGNLVAVTEEQDFEADGVIDDRETTHFR